jgi:hypothetical protein
MIMIIVTNINGTAATDGSGVIVWWRRRHWLAAVAADHLPD